MEKKERHEVEIKGNFTDILEELEEHLVSPGEFLEIVKDTKRLVRLVALIDAVEVISKTGLENKLSPALALELVENFRKQLRMMAALCWLMGDKNTASIITQLLYNQYDDGIFLAFGSDGEIHSFGDSTTTKN